METVTPPKPTPTLRRRNSTATSVLIPSKLSISTAAAAAATSSSSSTSGTTSSSSSTSSHSFSTIDFELTSIPSATSYTSLKDLLPSTAVQSPTSSAGASSGYEISIRNRLVKQAAWAYLQPMSTSRDSDDRSFFHRLWNRFSGDLVNSPVGSLFRHVIRVLTRAFDGLVRAICVRSSR